MKTVEQYLEVAFALGDLCTTTTPGPEALEYDIETLKVLGFKAIEVG